MLLSFFSFLCFVGTITVWDRDQALVWFELKGRSNRISSVQFDSHRLVSDGTYSLIVVHNFDVPYGSSDEQFRYDVEYTSSEQSMANEDNDSSNNSDNRDSDTEEDEDEDGTPSATS